ncbi:MAG: hypothetical protein ACSHYA_13665 [Opitutaceae bacterium]
MNNINPQARHRSLSDPNNSHLIVIDIVMLIHTRANTLTSHRDFTKTSHS